MRLRAVFFFFLFDGRGFGRRRTSGRIEFGAQVHHQAVLFARFGASHAAVGVAGDDAGDRPVLLGAAPTALSRREWAQGSRAAGAARQRRLEPRAAVSAETLGGHRLPGLALAGQADRGPEQVEQGREQTPPHALLSVGRGPTVTASGAG